MPVKLSVTQEEFDKLKAPEKVLYPTKGEDGTYALDIEGGLPDTSSINKKAIAEAAKLKAEKDDLQKKFDAVEAARLKAIKDAEDNNKGGDAKLQAEIEALNKKFEARELKLRTESDNSKVESLVSSMNGKWINDEVGQTMLEKRIRVSYEGDVRKISYVDSKGKEISTDFAEFQKKFLEEPAIKAILKANSSSGGGASQNMSGGNSTDLSSMTALEIAALVKSNPAKYLELRKQSKQK